MSKETKHKLNDKKKNTAQNKPVKTTFKNKKT